MSGHINFVKLPYEEFSANDVFLLSTLADFERNSHLDGGLIISEEVNLPAVRNYCGRHKIETIETVVKTEEQARELYSNLSGRFVQTTDSFIEPFKLYLERILNETDFSFQGFP